MNLLKIISAFILLQAQPAVARNFIVLESNASGYVKYHLFDFGDNKISAVDFTIDSSKLDKWPGRFRLFVITNNSFAYTIMLKDSSAFTIKNYTSLQKNMMLNSSDFIPNTKRVKEICDSLSNLNLPYYTHYDFFSSAFKYKFEFAITADDKNNSDGVINNLDSLQEVFDSYSKEYKFFVFPDFTKPKSEKSYNVIAFSNDRKMNIGLFSYFHYKISSEVKGENNTPTIYWPVPCTVK